MTNSFISERGRLISDILEMTYSLNMEGYLLTIDIEEAFESLAIIEKHCFKKKFRRWIELC